MVILLIFSLISAALLWACCKVSKMSAEEDEILRKYMDKNKDENIEL